MEKKADCLSKDNADKDATIADKVEVIADKDAKISHLKDWLEQAYRLLSGKKSERYTPADNVQQGLPVPHKSSITVRLFVSSGQLSLAWLTEYLGYFDLTGMVCDLR